MHNAGAVFSYKLRYMVGFWLVEMAISTNQKLTIYRNLYENTGPEGTYAMPAQLSSLIYGENAFLSKHDTFTQCWFNNRLTSQAVDQL